MPTSPTQSLSESHSIPDVLPVLALKDVVLFPYIIQPLSVGREQSIVAVDQALAGDRVVMLTAQKDPSLEEPGEDDLQRIGTAALIVRMLKLPDGRIRILVQGLARTRILHFSQTSPFLQARVEEVIDVPGKSDEGLEIEALVRSVKDMLEQAAGLGRAISPEVMVVAANLEEPGRLADLAASNLELRAEPCQEILECLDPVARLSLVADHLRRELQLLTMQQEISSQARGEMDRSQREYFLRQQLKAIQEELGEGDELAEEVAAFRKKAGERNLPEKAVEELEKQLSRLERTHPESAESSVIRTYLDWLTGLPWSLTSEDRLDIPNARKILDEDHYGLEKIKQRILEYLAVRRLKGDAKGPLLCFVGPPGVGKTSLGRSIARALGRKFVRLSLGGVRDEAEIRGHRRTYVGALPGRIIQGIHQAETSNPVFMLDEIDKIGSDFRGDPSAALLETLDPEQNDSFRDHYLGIPYDLSKVLFITTANLLEPILPAFLDRMEVIRISGYTASEKVAIARQHLIPKTREANGLDEGRIDFTDQSIRTIVSDYTKEAGLRNLEREISAICRKVAVEVAEGRASEKTVVRPKLVQRFLGPARHFSEELLDRDQVGVATGLAWTAAGGDLMFIEVVAVPGKGKLFLTGQLGEVMKESAQAALSWARHRQGKAGSAFFAENDLHIHVPAGSIPKDGPSAGITIATAILSTVTSKQVRRRLAMTGEITLRGDVLPIGGLKEKVLAARAAGISSIALPRLNRRDLAEIPKRYTRGLEFHLVDNMNEVLDLALLTGDKERPSVASSKTS